MQTRAFTTACQNRTATGKGIVLFTVRVGFSRFPPVSAGGRSLRATDGTFAARECPTGSKDPPFFVLGGGAGPRPVTAFAARGYRVWLRRTVYSA